MGPNAEDFNRCQFGCGILKMVGPKLKDFCPGIDMLKGNCFYRSWDISTTPNVTKFFFIPFKLIQQPNMVTLSYLAKKNQNLNARKKSSVYYWKLRFQGWNAHEPPFSGINWNFFPCIQTLIFLREATQNDHIRLLYKFERDKKNFGCVRSCGYSSASVKTILRWI